MRLRASVLACIVAAGLAGITRAGEPAKRKIGPQTTYQIAAHNARAQKPRRRINVPYEQKTPVITVLSGTVIVTPSPATNAVVNPGKGWVIYARKASEMGEAKAIGSIGYSRFNWSEIEPQENVYKWELIDDCIASWANAGRQFSFGVMCANTHGPEYVTPRWVFDAGARYVSMDNTPNSPYAGTPGKKVAPVFDDPIFLKKLRKFILAMGKRYDGNRAIAFIDIRSYGNWGEGHMYPFNAPDISKEKLREHLMMHLEAFHYTQLILPYGSAKFNSEYDWATARGIGMRRDGICGNSDGSETARSFAVAASVFEFFGSYEWLKKQGWWEGNQDQKGRGYRLADCVENGMPSFIGLSQGGPESLRFLGAERALIDELANRMGYHFLLREAKFPACQARGEKMAIELKWENWGVAPIYIPAFVRFALISADGTVADVASAQMSKPSAWMPDKPVAVRDTLDFQKASAGEYTLGVGITRSPDATQPEIKLGIDLKTVDGWYILGPVTIQ